MYLKRIHAQAATILLVDHQQLRPHIFLVVRELRVQQQLPDVVPFGQGSVRVACPQENMSVRSRVGYGSYVNYAFTIQFNPANCPLLNRQPPTLPTATCPTANCQPPTETEY